MIIGIPKEIMQNEKRVAAIPETVTKFINDGATVLVEAGAGEGSYSMDYHYQEAGATIVQNVEEIYNNADVILKVKEPLFNEEKQCHEIDMMKKGQHLITFLHPASPVNHEMIRNLAAKGVIGLTLDGVPRISRAQSMDALTSMSTCAGYKGMLMAADDLAKFIPQIFSAVGMLKPANVLVVGAGVSGLQAIATAKRLGAVVYAADIRPDACEQAKSLGAKIIDLGIPVEEAVGKGGYANSLSQELLEKEREVLTSVIKDMDIVLLTALVPGKVAPVLVNQAMVKLMHPGSVIVDISIDQGGNCSATEPGQVVRKNGVIIQGIKNIPGRVPTSSTNMFAKNVYNLLSYLQKDGKIVLDMKDEIVSSIVVTIDEKIVHKGALEAMGLL